MWGKLYGNLIIKGKYDYQYVISRRGDLKNEIDTFLIEEGHKDMIV